MIRSYLSHIMCDNAARNAFLDELNVRWRMRGAEKQMFHYTASISAELVSPRVSDAARQQWVVLGESGREVKRWNAK